MSVVFINCTGETFTPTRSGAIATWIWEMCQAAQKQGVEPWVITRTRADTEPYPWPRTILLNYPWIPNFRGTGLGRLLEIQRKVTGWGHVRQGAYAAKIVSAIRQYGLETLPFVLHNDPELAVHLRRCFPKATIIHHSHNANPCCERIRRQFACAVTVATGVSDFISGWAREYFDFGGWRVQTIYNGVDNVRFSPAPSVPEGPPVINFVGRTDSPKAPDLVLRAAKKLVAKTRNFSVQILGARYYWGTEPDEYQQMIEKLSHDLERDGITIRRPGLICRSALPDELRKAHIHVVPSRWDEPCALTIFEGMACGLATVGSQTGGTPEVIGDAGLLFQRDSVDELAGHLGNLIANDAMRTEYARKARARAETLTWEHTWSQFLPLLNSLCPSTSLICHSRSPSQFLARRAETT